MAIFSKLEDLVKGVLLESVILSELSFKEENSSDVVKKGKITIESKPSFNLLKKESDQKIFLELDIHVSGIGQDDAGENMPILSAQASLKCYFDVAGEYNLDNFKRIDDEPEFFVEYICRQVYPVARVALHGAIDGSGYKGITLPWHIPFTNVSVVE